MINRVETIIEYKGSLVQIWLEVVDDSDPDYVFTYEKDTETYYNIDRRNVIRQFKEEEPS